MEEHLDHSELESKTTKKRKKLGRLTDVRKKMRLQGHEMGADCNCKKRCFEVLPERARLKILQHFNLLPTEDEQNSYLCGLISVLPIKNRRPRNSEEEATLRDASYCYRVRTKVDDVVKEVPICKKAFMAIHGIKKGKVEHLLRSLKMTGVSPKNKRGKHNVRPRKLGTDTLNLIHAHIKSFKSRGSHYSLHQSSKSYLPEELNIKKMFQMFIDLHPDVKVSYETYRSIMEKDFNIAFGYPRTDTCSSCDEFATKKKSLVAEKNNASELDQLNIERKIKKIETEIIIHKKRAEQFYIRKKKAKLEARKTKEKEAICMDFSKNLPAPNLPTNDVYYKRQLSVYAFNVHVLSNSQSVFYMYSELIAKKGADDVASLLHHFVYNFLDVEVRNLEIFCDSCAGQNKNFTIFRFFHNLVHTEKRLDFVKITFPVRGHSYLECDKNVGLVNQKTRVEHPKEWNKVFQVARYKPSPFDVVDVQKNFFRKWTHHLGTLYKKKCPFPTRPVKEIVIEKEHPRLLRYRTAYNGAWETGVVKEVKKKIPKTNLRPGEFCLPDYSYECKSKTSESKNKIMENFRFLFSAPIPISKQKFDDLQHLKRFCGPDAALYYSNIPYKQ